MFHKEKPLVSTELSSVMPTKSNYAYRKKKMTASYLSRMFSLMLNALRAGMTMKRYFIWTGKGPFIHVLLDFSFSNAKRYPSSNT